MRRAISLAALLLGLASGTALAQVNPTPTYTQPSVNTPTVPNTNGGVTYSNVTSALGFTPPRLGTVTGTAYDGGLGAAAAALAAAAASTTANNTFTGLNTFAGTTTATPTGARNPFFHTVITSLNPTGESAPDRMDVTADMSGGASSEVTLGLDMEFTTTTGAYQFGGNYGLGSGGGEHQSGFYSNTFMDNTTNPVLIVTGTLPTQTVTVCTAGTNCPGSMFDANPYNVVGGNIGAGDLFNFRGVLFHSPLNNKSFTDLGYYSGTTGTGTALGGTTDNYVDLYDDGCSSGTSASMCYLAQLGANAAYEDFGLGTATPIAEMHIRGGDNLTVTATGWIDSNGLHLSTSPSYNLMPGAIITGGGMTQAELLSAAPAIPLGFSSYNISGSAQTIGSQSSPVTFNFAEAFLPLLLQNYNGTNTRMAFITDSGAMTTITGEIDQRYDATIGPLAQYFAFMLNGSDVGYIYQGTGTGHGAAGTRASGLAIGYTTITALPDAYTLAVNGGELLQTLYATNTKAIETTGSVGINTGITDPNLSAELQVAGTGNGTEFNTLFKSNAGTNLFGVEDTGLTIAYGRIQANDAVATNSQFMSPGMATLSSGAAEISGIGTGNLSTGATDAYVAFSGYHACNKGGSLAEVVCDGPSSVANATAATHITALGYSVGTSVVAGTDDILIGDSGNADFGSDVSHEFGIWGGGNTPVIISTAINTATPLTTLNGTITMPGSVVLSNASPSLTFNVLPTGTAATYACFTAAGKLVSSATACP